MKKTTVKWIAAGTLVACLASFSAGMVYALNRLKKIDAEDLAPATEDKDEPTEETNA